MKTENPVRDKSYTFALKVVKLCFKIQEDKKEYILSKQLLRSATSVGANVEEAIGGQSDRDFLHKLSISYKEAREAKYWIRLLGDVEIISNEDRVSLLQDAEELLRIIGSIQITLKKKIERNIRSKRIKIE